MQTTPCGSERETVAVTIILRRNETTRHDEVFLEERLVPATGGGTIGLVGGKLDYNVKQDGGVRRGDVHSNHERQYVARHHAHTPAQPAWRDQPWLPCSSIGSLCKLWDGRRM